MVDLRQWLKDHQGQLALAGVSGRFAESDSNRAKTSQVLRLDSAGGAANAIVWESGECEILYGSDSDRVTVEQRRVTTPEDLDAVMAELLAHL